MTASRLNELKKPNSLSPFPFGVHEPIREYGDNSPMSVSGGKTLLAARTNWLRFQVRRLLSNSKVGILTTDEGPWQEDVFFLLITFDGKSGCVVPQSWQIVYHQGTIVAQS